MNKKIKECFGDQGGAQINGESPEDCLNCDIDTFERCHKVSVATFLQGISIDISIIVQNGLKNNWLKSFKELSDMDEDIQ